MDNQNESLVRHLMDSVRCSVCEAKYQPENISILGHQDELWFVSVRCSSCQTQGLIAAVVKGEEIVPPPPILEPREPPADLGEPVGDSHVTHIKDILGENDTLVTMDQILKSIG